MNGEKLKEILFTFYLLLFTVLHVRNEPGDILVVNRLDNSTLAQVTFPLACLTRQNMAGEGVAPLDLAGTGFFEALGGAPVGLDLWHAILLTGRYPI